MSFVKAAARTTGAVSKFALQIVSLITYYLRCAQRNLFYAILEGSELKRFIQKEKEGVVEAYVWSCAIIFWRR